jgi:hypothetical protein
MVLELQFLYKIVHCWTFCSSLLTCHRSNRTTYNECLKSLYKDKSSSLHNILDDILKALPPQLHDIPMFQTIILPKSIPDSWKHSKIMLIQIDDLTFHINCRPKGLSLYKIQTLYKHYHHSPFKV